MMCYNFLLFIHILGDVPFSKGTSRPAIETRLQVVSLVKLVELYFQGKLGASPIFVEFEFSYHHVPTFN